MTAPQTLPIKALEAFSARLPRGGRVLCADSNAAFWLTQRGIEIQALDPSKDPRFLSLKRESFDGVWAGRTFAGLSIEDAQRVVATFFQALTPRVGVFFAFHSYPETAFESLLRQNGLHVLLQGQGQNELAIVCQRI